MVNANIRTNKLMCNTRRQGRRRLGTIIFYFFLILCPFDSFIGSALSFPLLSVVYFLYVLVFLGERTNFNLNKIKFDVITVYLIISCCSIVYATFKVGFVYNNLLFLQMLVFYLIAKNRYLTKSEYLSIVKLSPYIMVIYIIINLLYMRITGIGVYAEIKSIVDPNYFTTNMVFVLTLFCFDLHGEKHRGVKVAKIAILILYFIVIAIIGSRGGLLSSVSVCGIYYISQSKKPMKSLFITLTLCVIAGVMAFAFLPQYITERFTIENMIGGGGSGRLTIWKNYLLIYSEQNIFGLLFGVGRNCGEIAYLQFGRVYYAHNIFIRTLLEMGLIGFIALIGVFYKLLRYSWRNKNSLIFVSVCGLIIGGMFLDLDNMRVFWLILSFAVLHIKNRKIFIWKGKAFINPYNDVMNGENHG